MRRRGVTMVETLVTIIVLGIVMGGLLQAFSTMWTTTDVGYSMSDAQINAQQMATTLSEAFRNATLCTSSDSGCTVGAPIQSASSTACTVYSRSSGTLVETTYQVVNGNFQESVNGGAATTIYTGATLSLTYYSSSSYYATSMTTFTPTASTASQLVAVGINTSVTIGGITSNYTTLVRVVNY